MNKTKFEEFFEDWVGRDYFDSDFGSSDYYGSGLDSSEIDMLQQG